MTGSLELELAPEERAVWETLDSPMQIQAFLDQVDYRGEETNRSVVRVLRERQAHCLDGGVFAAAALRQLGHPPVIVDLLPEPGTDDDHVLAIFKSRGHFGAVAKSNFAGLRFREPVYRGLRELVMSYFEAYFNLEGRKTLRFYTRPLNLATLDRLHWQTEDAGVDAIERLLPQLRRVALLTPEQAAALAPVDSRSYQSGMIGTNQDGLYRPKV
jgi:hypothetical protein